MSDFPRTTVAGVSMPRMIIGTNWFLGYSHTSRAKDRMIKDLFDTPARIADVMEVFVRNGIDATMALGDEFFMRAVRETEQRTGRGIIFIATPGYGAGRAPSTWEQAVEYTRKIGSTFCFPHQCITDPRIDRAGHCLMPELVDHLRLVRSYGMLPGLSTHTPEAITCADDSGADTESYVQPFNAAGFLCQVETDWVQRVIANAKHPVMCIKPMAAGRLLPPTGLTFVWNNIRDCDMVTVGTMSVYEAEEVIEISRACLERRTARVELQTTRSKKTLTG